MTMYSIKNTIVLKIVFNNNCLLNFFFLVYHVYPDSENSPNITPPIFVFVINIQKFVRNTHTSLDHLKQLENTSNLLAFTLLSN